MMMKLSTAKRKITPKKEFFPLKLSGHAIRKDDSTGVLDDLYTEILLLDVKGQKLLFIVIELIGLDKSQSEEMSLYLSKMYPIKRENIIITFTHTHSAPEYSTQSLFSDENNANAKSYMDWVTIQVYDAVKECFTMEETEVNTFL